MYREYSIAVIIPTLNEEKYISLCLESVLKQSYPFSKLDIMIIDGGSQDHTISVVQEFQKRYDNIRLINNPKKIQSVAFNIGISASTAPYIIRLDAHAIYHKDYIALCIKHLKKHPEYGNVGGICNIVSYSGSLISKSNAILNKMKFGIGGASFRVGSSAKFVDTVPFGAFSRYVLDKVGGMREDLVRGEDNEINSRLRQNGYKIFLDPKISSTYYSRETVSASMKQMYNNGISIGHLFYVDNKAISFRHLIPLLFVSSLVFCFVLGLFIRPFVFLGLYILSLYFIASIIASISASLKEGLKYLFVLPWLFFLIHVSYGIGTIVGVINNK